jgi:hypothetical protein
MDHTFSFSLDEMPVERLIQISQGLGHQAEKIRAQRAYLRQLIDKRLAAGESDTREEAVVTPGVVLTVTTETED